MNPSPAENSHKPGSRKALLGFCCVVAVAAVFRLWDLDRRVMHGDEANQAIKSAILLETGKYAYDPVEHHGPLLYFLSLGVERLAGHDSRAAMTETSLRVIPAAFGIATVGILWLLRGVLGTPAVLFGACLMALSPALTFYSRYYIQESLLVFFTIAALVCGLRYARHPAAGWAIGFGASVGLMHASKETAVLAWMAMGVSAGVTLAAAGSRPTIPKTTHLAAATVAAVVVSAALFSSFGANPRGVLDSVLTYAGYLGKSGEPSAHTHGWLFYLDRLTWYHRGQGPYWTEGLILAAAILGVVVSIRRVRAREQSSGTAAYGLFCTTFAVSLLAIYSAIPYKTPWNLIQFLAPLCIVGGIGFGAIWCALRYRAAKSVLLGLLVAASAHLGWLNQKANFEYAEYPYNPYVYGHTSSAFSRLFDRIEHVSEERADGKQMLIAVIQPDADYWPLPWYLRHFSKVGYWTVIPDPLPPAAVFIVDPALSSRIGERLGDGYTAETHGLRPRILRTVYVEKSLE